MQTLITTILFQAGLNVFLFWSNRKKNSNDFYLIVLMALFLIHTGFKYLLWLIAPDYNTFNKIQGCFSLLYGPYLLFYLNSILGTSVEKHIKRYHLVPFLLAFVLNVKIMVDVLIFGNRLYLEGIHEIMVFLVLSSTLGYAVFVLARLKKLPVTDDLLLAYKLKIVRAIAIFLAIPATAFVLNFLLPLPSFLDRFVWYSGMIVMMAVVLNYRFKISSIYKSEEAQPVKEESKKYQHSSLSAERMEQIVQEIVMLMNTSKPYLNPDFSLEDMAELTSIPKHHITEGLNSSQHINFYKFVNQFRVEESKRLIRNMGPDQNLIGVGFDSGFKSKSTFNKYFKELTGSSPSEYLRATHGILA